MKDDRITGIENRGFVKAAVASRSPLTGEQRAALIRKGNEVFNKGDFATAERIFITVKYADGLIRIGDRYYKSGNALEAFKMYRQALDKTKTDLMLEKMAIIIRGWLEEHDE
jgi:hypothetical protein